MKSFTLNEQAQTRPNDRYWQFCVGSGHAALALRADYQKQLKRAHEELGFRRVRFHGIFDDDMRVLTSFHDYLPVPGGKRVKTQSFYHIAVLFDALLEIGIRPFVELGFMPSPLARGKRTVFYYKGNVTPPAEQESWRRLIQDFLRFLIKRYGKAEVESWYFEVWNEPDLRGFFWTGTQEEYFQLYKTTVNAIKDIDPNIRVGGPATSQNRWLTDMRTYCERESLPLDFLSTHHYPGDDVGLPILTKENISRMLFAAKRNPGDNISQVIHKMMYRPQLLPLIQKDSMLRQAQKARREAGDIPLHYTEWNVNPTCTAPLHDTIQSSAYVVKHVLDCQYVMDGCSFWCFSDIFEENTFLPQPFTGSFGLMNIYGIPKPSYWAFYLLGMLGDERYVLPTTHADVEFAAFRSEDEIQMLVYHQSYVMRSGEAEPVVIRLQTNRKVQSVHRWRIDRAHGNPLPLWQELGSPELLTPAQAAEIESKTRLSPEEIPFQATESGIVLETQIADNDVQLITVSLQKRRNQG